MQTNLIDVPECSSVSQLDMLAEFSQLSDNTLLLVSQPNANTDTGYISKSIQYGDIAKGINDKLCIDIVKQHLLSVEQTWNDFKSHLSNHVLGEDDNDSPHIISSITVVSSLLSTVNTYPLSAGIDTVLIKQNPLILTYDNIENNIVLSNFSGSIYSRIDRDEILSDALSDFSSHMISSVHKVKSTIVIEFKVGERLVPISIDIKDLYYPYSFSHLGSYLSSSDIKDDPISVNVDIDELYGELSSNATYLCTFVSAFNEEHGSKVILKTWKDTNN